MNLSLINDGRPKIDLKVIPPTGTNDKPAWVPSHHFSCHLSYFWAKPAHVFMICKTTVAKNISSLKNNNGNTNLFSVKLSPRLVENNPDDDWRMAVQLWHPTRWCDHKMFLKRKEKKVFSHQLKCDCKTCALQSSCSFFVCWSDIAGKSWNKIFLLGSACFWI